MRWIEGPIQLKGKFVSLIPLDKSHFDDLLMISKEKKIWEHYVIDGSDSLKLQLNMEKALEEKEKGVQYPFVIISREQNKIIGSTRFLDIQKEHKKLEIGWTWLHPDYWGTKVNLECKFLLLSYCFEELLSARVLLKTDQNNKRSRKAIEKIGGQLEGILRNDMIRDNGTNRHSAYYSIIDSEWYSVKQKIILALSSR